MIDCENLVFEFLNAALSDSSYGNLAVSSADLPMKASFPYVYAAEADNYTKTDTMDSSMQENHARVMFEIKIYSNRPVGKREEAKRIFNVLDKAFIARGFLRKTKISTPINDGSIFEIIGRYEAVVSKDYKVFWR